MSEERKSIKAGKLVNKNPDKRLLLTIKEQSVKTEHIADNAITPQKVSSDAVQYITADVQNQIDSIQIGGWAISNQLGNDSHIGISQKALTDIIGYDNAPNTVRGRITNIENEKGAASGIATLDTEGKVPSSQLPSYVDDVIDGYFYNNAFYADENHTQLLEAETGKIYVDVPTKVSYRYSGSAYVAISNPYFPDEEDLTVSNDIIKFKDKAYSAASYSGLGKKYLRKNMVGGVNILTQSMVNAANTEYIIRYDYDLNGAEISLLGNCVLKFEGGSLSNGTISGESVIIESSTGCLHDITLNIKVNNGYVHWKWAKDISDLQSLINASSEYDGVLDLDESVITISEPFYIDRRVNTKKAYYTIKNGTITLNTDYGFYSNLSTGSAHPHSEYVRFDNVLFMRNSGSNGIVFRDCDFLRVKVENCEFEGVPLINEDTSGLYLQSYYIHNCLFRNYTESFINVPIVYDVHFTNNSVESSLSSTFIQITSEAHVFTATDNLVESVDMFADIEKCTGVSIISNYFELLPHGIIAIRHTGNDYVSGGFVFMGNRCQTMQQYAELDDDGKYYYITIGFVKKFIIYGNTFYYTAGSSVAFADIVNILNTRSYGLIGDYTDVANAHNKNYLGVISLKNNLPILDGTEVITSALRSGSYFPSVDEATFVANMEATENSLYTRRALGKCILNVLANPITKEKIIEETLTSSYNVKNLPIRYLRIINDTGYYVSKKVRMATLIDEAYGDDWNSDDLDIGDPDIGPSYFNGIMRFIPNKGLQVWHYNGWESAFDGMPVQYNRKGTTSARPALSNSIFHIGFLYFDTTLGKPIWWTGTKWVDATGTQV